MRDPEAMVTHHILDSLAMLSWLNGRTVLDVGSGAGLPGIPLAIACPLMQFTLLDSSAKRTRFMQQMKAELDLGNVNIVTSRAESYNPDRLFDCVVARAVASLRDLLRLAGRLCTTEGRFLALKGQYPERELNAITADAMSRFQIVEIAKLSVPGLHAERHLVWLQPTVNAVG